MDRASALLDDSESEEETKDRCVRELSQVNTSEWAVVQALDSWYDEADIRNFYDQYREHQSGKKSKRRPSDSPPAQPPSTAHQPPSTAQPSTAQQGSTEDD